MGEGVVAGEDTKMTARPPALAERGASRLLSPRSPQVRLASLQPEA